MAITFIDFALSGTTDSTTLNITLPTVQSGDVMFLEYTHRSTGTGTLGGVGGSGWTNKSSNLYATDTFSHHLYYKRCDGTESGDALTVTGLTNSCAGCVTVYRGVVATGDPIEAFSEEDNASGNETHAQITTLTNLAWVVLTVANSPDLAVSSQTCTSPGALTERAERLNTTGTDTSIAHASAEKATAGATGALTWAQTDGVSSSMAYAIKPAMPEIALPAGTLAMVGLSVGVAFFGPAAGVVAFTGHAPTVLVESGLNIPIPAGSLVLTGQAPALDTAVPIPAGSLVFSSQPPTVEQGLIVAIPAGAVGFTGLAADVSTGINVALPAGSLVFTGYAPASTESGAIQIPAGSLVWSGLAPAVSIGVNVALPAGGLTFTGYAPTLGIAGGTTIDIPAGSLVLTGQYVGVSFSLPSPGQLTFTGYAPTLAISGQTNIAIPAGSLVFTGLATTVARAIDLPAGTLAFTGQTSTQDFTIAPAAGTLTFTGLAPAAFVEVFVPIPAGQIVLTGYAPGVSGSFAIGIPAGSLVFTGHAPSTAGTVTIAPSVGVLTFTGLAPTFGVGIGLPAGQVTVTGYAPTIDATDHHLCLMGVGSLVWQGRTPTLDVPPEFAGITAVSVSVTHPQMSGITVTHPGLSGVTITLPDE